MLARHDIAVVGAGAAGLAAAIRAAQTAPGLRIALLDGARRLGAKILVSGGGRCNVTHDRVGPEDFHAPRHLVRHVLAAFDQERTVRWLGDLGVTLKREEGGKLFPTTDDARTVLETLLGRCRQLGVAVMPRHRVLAIRAEDAGFRVETAAGTNWARRTIIATGGQSLPRTGSDGAGYKLARSLGHTVSETAPALVPLRLGPGFFHRRLAGVAHVVSLTTIVATKRVDRRCGPLLWAHFGISGPVVLDASRFWVLAQRRNLAPALRANLVPDLDFNGAQRWLLDQAATRRALVSVLAERLPQRVAVALLEHGGIDGRVLCHQLPRPQRHNLVNLLTELELPVVGDRGWQYAEVTAGGVPLDEIDHRTMASRKQAGLYLAGEILDCDGRIGGFNFQWAWSTGHIAGRAAAEGCMSSAKAQPPAIDTG